MTALAEEARKFGMSAGEYARRLVREGLESRFRQEADDLRAGLAKAQEEIRRITKEYPLAFRGPAGVRGAVPRRGEKVGQREFEVKEGRHVVHRGHGKGTGSVLSGSGA